ncbi:MAG: homoserine kinase [Clostridia bacterium]|nr:homoserine kinase [Clostridia bacterium]
MVKLRVGATSANIGPGFDCIGVALNLYNTVSIEESDECVVISRNIKERADENNIFIKSARAVYDMCGKPFYGIRVTQETKIPPARGLGSSSACISAAICGANALLGEPLKKADLIDLAASLEGHPDNTTPCIAGGLCFCVYDGERVRYNRISIGRKLMFCALVPDFRMKTSKSRRLIPQRVSHADAAFNVSRAAYLASAFYERDFGALKVALSDRLHQPYRLPHIEGADEVTKKLREFSPYGIYLSGAGPTIMAVSDAADREFAKNVRGALKERGLNWRVLPLFSDAHGVKIIE